MVSTARFNLRTPSSHTEAAQEQLMVTSPIKLAVLGTAVQVVQTPAAKEARLHLLLALAFP